MRFLLSKLIGIAGPLGSGKSSLTRAIASALPATRVSFGAFVVARAQEDGTDPTREVLQILGERLLTNCGAAKFVELVLEYHKVGDKETIVVDGVRHVAVWHELRRRSADATLVYLDVPLDLCVERLRVRDSISLDNAQSQMSHQMEQRASCLRDLADVVLEHGEIAAWLTRVIAVGRSD